MLTVAVFGLPILVGVNDVSTFSGASARSMRSLAFFADAF
jgi:hypothetical protein